MMRRKTKFFYAAVTCLLGLLMLISGCGQANQPAAPANAGGQQAAATNIKVIDNQGNTKAIDLASLPQVKGTGIFKKSTGALVGPAELSGPRLSDVLKAAGVEQSESDGLEFVASDGYKMTLDSNQVSGRVMTYQQDGKAAAIKQLDVIIALQSSDSEVGEGLPRLAYIGEGNPISDGHLWVKLIDTISVKTGVADWTIKLSGYGETTVDRATFESGATCTDTPHLGQKVEFKNAKGGVDKYEGLGLWLMVAVVDGGDAADGHYRVNRDIVRSGYTVKVISKNGKSKELKAIDVSYNDKIVLAYKKNSSLLGDDQGPLVLINNEDADKPEILLEQVVEIQLLNLPKQ